MTNFARNGVTVSTKQLPPKKLKLMMQGMIVVFLAISIFLVRWEVVDYDKYIQLASQRYKTREITALRGDILAADGSVLDYSEPRYDIFVFKNAKVGLIAAENAGRQTRAEFIKKVSDIIEITPDALSKLLEQNSQWIKIADKITLTQKDNLLTIPTDKNPKVFLDGISFQDNQIRVFPEANLAAHVLGYLGKDELGNDIGGSGLEQYFNGVLKPQSGISNVETDSNQNIIALSNNLIKDPRQGATVVTTINKNIQAKVQKRLKEAVQKFKAQSGVVIVVDPRTGGVISLANYPDYDPNNYGSVSDIKVLGDIAVTSPYEIGSVGKIFTMATAVDQGKVGPDTIVINGHKGCQKIIEQRVICTDDKKPQGPMTATEALIKSDNLALFATANLVGSQTLADYLAKFGMGQKTNIQLAGEDSGYLKPGDQWNEADMAAYSYGHSYYQTPIQAIMGVAALANDGKRMEPMIVSELRDADGSVKKYTPRVIAQVVKPESAKTMTDMLYRVFLNNLSYEKTYRGLSKYRIGMKSGTGLIPYSALAKPENKPGYSDEVDTTYVGYDGSSKNSFIMIVNLTEPQTNPKLSYNNARYLWLDIFSDIKDDLGVPVVY